MPCLFDLSDAMIRHNFTPRVTCTVQVESLASADRAKDKVKTHASLILYRCMGRYLPLPPFLLVCLPLLFSCPVTPTFLQNASNHHLLLR